MLYVDCHSHRQIAEAVGVQLVVFAADGRVVDERGLELAGVRIERRLVEVEHRVEEPRAADEFVQCLAFGILLGRAVVNDPVARIG